MINTAAGNPATAGRQASNCKDFSDYSRKKTAGTPTRERNATTEGILTPVTEGMSTTEGSKQQEKSPQQHKFNTAKKSAIAAGMQQQKEN
jgi:hypothetical protein